MTSRATLRCGTGSLRANQMGQDRKTLIVQTLIDVTKHLLTRH